MRTTITLSGNVTLFFEDNGPYGGISLLIFVTENIESEVKIFKCLYFNDCSDKLELRRNFSEYHLFVSSENVRYVVDKLHSAKLMCDEQRNFLEPLLYRLERYSTYKSRIVDYITPTQEEILIDFIEPYLDGVLLDDLNKTLKSIRLLEIHSFPDDFSFPDSPAEYLDFIGMVYRGKAKLESTLLQCGNSLPMVEVQQETIKHFLYKKIVDKFNITNNEIKFVLHMALINNQVVELISNYPSFNPTIINETELKNFFNYYANRKYLWNDFVNYVVKSLSILKISFHDLDLKKYMTNEQQLAFFWKLNSEDDISGLRRFFLFSTKLLENKEIVRDPILTATEGNSERDILMHKFLNLEMD